MKIGFAIGKLNYSGAEKIARYLIAALHEKGHEIGIMFFATNKPYPEFDYAEQYFLSVKGNRLKRILTRNKHIAGIIKDANFDVIISFGAISNVHILRAAKKTGTPVIVCERNSPIQDPPQKGYRIMRSLLYPKAAGYVFQTERIADYFGEKIKNKSKIIPNFIEEKYENFYRDDAENNMVITARLDDNQKNISMLLRAFKTFSQDHDYRLYIVGDGPDEAKFKSYVEENGLSDKVIFTGRQNVMDYLKIAKIFVLPSHFEGMPNSLIEALGSGLPSIATDCDGGGSAYLIEDHVNGILTPKNDEAAFLAAMRELADNAELRRALSTEAYKINERLEFSGIIRMWTDYVEEVCVRSKK
ncbi:MAG: glycosyltransferase [Clostridia bacterium]|nr:glycosyltransferase [Clostridia bacterium]